MVKRNITFEINANGEVAPIIPQYGGVKGEHNATLMRILFANELYSEGDVVRLSFTTGNGAVVSSDILEVTATAEETCCVEYLLPQLLTVSGGQLGMHVVISKMENGQEVAAYRTHGMVVYFEEASIENGTPFWTGVSQMLIHTAQAADRAEQAAAGLASLISESYTLTDADAAAIAKKLEPVCVAKDQGSANVGKILVVGTDGNLVLMDMPEIGEGGTASGDIIGVIDDSNNILLSGNLADGTYTLKYENEDGTYSEIGTLEVGAIEDEEPEEIEIVNQIPISIDSSGAVYNGTGYKSNTRLSSEGVTEKSPGAKTCVLTGHIHVVGGDVIRAKNVTFVDGTSTTGYISVLWLYNSLFELIDFHSIGVNGSLFTPVLENDIYSFTIPADANIAYMRVQAAALDDTSIITVNQKIV